MATRIVARTTRRLLDRGGIALPLALLGLVIASLLVTTALLTSTTEAATSQAHQDGTRALYRADAAVEGFLANRAAALAEDPQPLRRGSFAFGSPTGGFEIAVALLRTSTSEHPTEPKWRRRFETFAITALPADGRGRAVGALYTVLRDAPAEMLQLDAAASVGGSSIRTASPSVMLSGVDTSHCATGDVAGLAMAAETRNHVPAGHVDGGIVHSPATDEAFARQILNDRTPRDLAALAGIQWGGPSTNARPWSGFGSAAGSLARSSGMNWGCPLGVGIPSCESDPDREYFPVVALDPPVGQAAELRGHGQGMLLVLGDARVTSSFVFKGVVLIAGDLRTDGRTSIHGVLLALGDAADGNGGKESVLGGRVEIRFDRCQVDRAQQALSDAELDLAPQQFGGQTFAWFEVVR